MNLSKFIEEYEKRLNKHYTELEEIQNKEKELIEQNSLGNVGKNTFKVDTELIRWEKIDLAAHTKKQLQEIADKFKTRLEEDRKPNGELIDDNVIKLLNSPIKLTREELQEIADSFYGNNTMLRILNEYGTQRDLSITFTQAESRIKEVDAFINSTVVGIENNGEGYWGINTKEPQHRESFISEFKNKM